MDCREVQDHLSEFQEGALAPAESEGIGAHLRECLECAGTAHSLAAIREGLRRLPPVPAPPELVARVREAVAREGAAPGSPDPAAAPRGKSPLSRLRLPLEAAAALLLVASIWWYQKGAVPPPVPLPSPSSAGSNAPAPSGVPDPAARQAEISPKPPGRETRISRKADETSSSAGVNRQPAATADVRGKEVASLPPGTPEPRLRTWSPADLPAAPAVRASSSSARIVAAEPAVPAPAGVPERGEGGVPGAPKDIAPSPAPKVLAAPPSRLLRPLPYGREILLDVGPEGGGSAGERVADAARRSGGSVERVERDASGQTVVAVRVLLPEPAATSFLSELDRIGKVPPEGKPAEVDIPAGPARGTVAYTVRIRVRQDVR
jgi:hypothetical protein